MRVIKLGLLLILVVGSFGCAMGWEFGKDIFGVSTKAIEDDREHGAAKTYDKSFDDCYDAAREALTKMQASVFLHKYHKHLVVAIGFKGAVDTTEVGIFFDEISQNKTKIDIVSLNKSLQINVSDEIFAFLDKRFNVEPVVNPDEQEEDSLAPVVGGE